MYFEEVIKALAKKGWIHERYHILSKLNLLVKQERIVLVDKQYALVQNDGSCARARKSMFCKLGSCSCIKKITN